MGDCSSTSHCNPCGPEFNAFNQLASKAAVYARQANTYAVNAENAWTEFNSLYLGAFAAAPTKDNDGNTLQIGALYWNIVSNQLFVWNGLSWTVANNFNEFTTFLATGTTNARNLVTRTADVANVKDFGAIGDGITDDTAAIQNAINIVNINGGGTVFFPPGVYGINGENGPFSVFNPSHGGGIELKDGVRLLGSGIGITTLKNIVDNWRMVVGIRGGNNIAIENLTIDGDWPNKTAIPVSSDPKRGEGIIFWNGTSDCENLLINNVEVKNTSHYGIGFQNVNIQKAIVNNIFFQNIGGDCIDIKDTFSGSNQYRKKISISNLITLDGCGNNYIPGDFDNNAVIDIGGECVVSNVLILGLDSVPGQLGNVGVRFRAPVNASNRRGSKGSSATNVTVISSKEPTEGSGTAKRIIGISINDEQITIGNTFVQNCYWGIRAFDTADGVPQDCSIKELIAVNCKGAASDGIGIFTTNATRRIQITGTARECDIGANLSGQKHVATLTLKDNTIGLDNTNNQIVLNTISLSLENNTTPSTSSYVSDGMSHLFSNTAKITAQRLPYLDLISNADVNDWIAPDVYSGGIRFYSADTTGSPAGFKAAIRGRMSSPTGGFTCIEITGSDGTSNDIPCMRIFGNRVENLFPSILPSYTVIGAPTPSSDLIGGMIYVTNESGGAVPAFCDGTNWRRVTDRAIIS